jgi:probable phosphoglycerate mutase
MTRVFLIRHAAIDGLGERIAGRMSVALNAHGRAQAARLARRFAADSIHALYSSPQLRATQTAQTLAAALGLEIQLAAELDEVDFGNWTGKTYDELRGLSEWRLFNTLRSATRIPNGELLLETQARMVALLERLRRRHPGQTVALVSHADPIRLALIHQLGAPLDFLLRLEIGPASVSAVELGTETARVLYLNSPPAGSG